MITHYQIQLKVTYQPQDDKKCGHAHDEQRNGFEFRELELESHFVRLRVGGCGFNKVSRDGGESEWLDVAERLVKKL